MSGRTAFVLGGGGLLGAVEVGMVRALLEHDITPDLVLGTSVGALNGAYLAARIAGASQAEAGREGHRVASIVIGEPGALVDPRLVRRA